MIEEFELRPSRWWRKTPKATKAALERYIEDQEASRGTWRDPREGANTKVPRCRTLPTRRTTPVPAAAAPRATGLVAEFGPLPSHSILRHSHQDIHCHRLYD